MSPENELARMTFAAPDDEVLHYRHGGTAPFAHYPAPTGIVFGARHNANPGILCAELTPAMMELASINASLELMIAHVHQPWAVPLFEAQRNAPAPAFDKRPHLTIYNDNYPSVDIVVAGDAATDSTGASHLRGLNRYIAQNRQYLADEWGIMSTIRQPANCLQHCVYAEAPRRRSASRELVV